jgi:hypothetical protein
MLEFDSIIHQVLQNCDISDARHAGLYSVCGLALRLRDLYKWEKGLNPWEEKDSSEVLEWIGNKEKRWEQIAEKDYLKLSIGKRKYDPFDTGGINRVLEPHGLFYGAGYARSLKPTFFLAVIEGKSKTEGYPVYTLDRELARDLFSMPALSQDGFILLRKESAKLLIWDQMLYIGKSGRQALHFALKSCGIKDQRLEALKLNIAKIFEAQRATYIYHEIGEIEDMVFDRNVWREVIGVYSHTAVELLARAVKDLLADTSEYGTLRHFIQKRKTAALAFYVAFFDGLAKKLFPELIESFRQFVQTPDWHIIESAVSIGYHTARRHAEEIITIFEAGKQKQDKNWAQEEIEKRLLPKVESATD